MKTALTQERLKELMHYNPETGVFTRLVSVSHNAKAGDVVGHTASDGYLRCKIDSKSYQMQRLAHLYVKGYFPEYQMDHKEGIRDDNRWNQIRHVTNACNSQNRMLSTKNTSGFTGVCWHKNRNKWIVKVKLNKRQIYLGYHHTALDAALARLTFEINCLQWSCNSRGVLVGAIKAAWPEFNAKSLSPYVSS